MSDSSKKKILVIPDTQCKPDTPTEHLEALGRYIVAKKPDIIVHLGDHWDFPSISSYSKKMEVEGKRLVEDIDAGKVGMAALMSPLLAYNAKRKRHKKRPYRPEMHFLLGNHEDRLKRYISDNPSLDGVINYPSDLGVEQYGWKLHDFLAPVSLQGFTFSHYFYNPMSGRAYGGTAHTKLSKVKTSFVMGHQQSVDVATSIGNDGTRYWGIVAGSFYLHDEGYIGYQANHHWRGVVMLHEAVGGDCNPCLVGIDYLMDNYS